MSGRRTPTPARDCDATGVFKALRLGTGKGYERSGAEERADGIPFILCLWSGGDGGWGKKGIPGCTSFYTAQRHRFPRSALHPLDFGGLSCFFLSIER